MKYLIPTLFLFFLLLFVRPAAANELSLGRSARSAGPVDIQIMPPADFNFRTRADIFDMRRREVLKHYDLLKGNYAPDDSVFGRMEDRRPWWGTVGQGYYGKGERSIVGPSIVSYSILNPFVLACLHVTPGLPRSAGEAALARSGYLALFQATGLRWWPREGKGEVTFLVSNCENQLSSAFGTRTNVVSHLRAALDLINARDLGLNYFYIPPAGAYNMQVGIPMREAMTIPQFVHCGGSCGYPGGCNNVSPRMAQLDDLEIVQLPARVMFMFWKNAPCIGHEAADMIFTVNFQ